MTLTLAGWFTMLLSVGGVTTFLAWCIWRVIRDPRAQQDLHAPLDAGVDRNPEDRP